MYWFTKYQQKGEERTYAVSPYESHAEACRQILTRSGHPDDEVRIISAMTLEEGANDSKEYKKIFESHCIPC